MTYAIDRPAIKPLLRIAGIFITFIAVLGAVDSAGFILGGIEKKNPWPVLFGLGTFIAYFGIAGAWIRIANIYESLSSKKVRLIRGLLYCGVIGSLMLAAGTFGIFPINIGIWGLVFIGLGTVGAFFIKQTPSRI